MRLYLNFLCYENEPIMLGNAHSIIITSSEENFATVRLPGLPQYCHIAIWKDPQSKLEEMLRSLQQMEKENLLAIMKLLEEGYATWKDTALLEKIKSLETTFSSDSGQYFREFWRH